MTLLPLPVLVIVGAGPGNPELITLKGINELKKADVILYDALVSRELLDYAKSGCKLIDVGKRKGKKEFSQDEINKLIVFYTFRSGRVVRLKGGDAYVFGRGHEEREYALAHGVSVEVIPGVSSALAAAAAATIPLTKRGVNESFWVVTGTTSNEEISADFFLAAKSSATVVVLMGLARLCKIAETIAESRSPLEPMAVIQNATLPEQKVVIGNAATIYRLVEENKITTPSVIIIGKVVNECDLAQTESTKEMLLHI